MRSSKAKNGALWLKINKGENVMLNFMKKEANQTFTENGAVTYESTGSECLDLFSTIGALRQADDKEIIIRFIRAYTENPDLAMKILFFARDIRNGLGERKVFRLILNWLAVYKPETVKKNMGYVAEFGRFDDLLALLDTECESAMMEYIKKQLEADKAAMMQKMPVSLLAKWLPSVNASNKTTVKNAKRIAKAMGFSDAEYRKELVELRSYIRILENNLREKDYTFDYEKQPSKAMYKYRKAFIRNDGERYQDFLSRVEEGKAKLHADNVAPYELVEPFLYRARYGSWYEGNMENEFKKEEAALNATWNSLPDFGGDENAITVVDTSGSMYDGMAAAVAVSLGLYFAERNKGIFKNHFISFSERPQLIEVKGETFTDRVRYIASFNEIANTNLEAVFDLILNAAVKNRVKQEDLPAKIIIISDMEFDCCMKNASVSNFENAKANFAAHGYQMPEVVFWNAASRKRQQPVTMNEQGVALVSGVTPKIFSMVAGGIHSPYKFMLDVVGSERYAKIVA